MDPIEITAGTLHLRPFTGADASRVYDICQDADLQRWTAVPVPYEQQHALEFTAEIVPRGWSTGSEAIFAVCDATSGQVLGAVGLHLDRGGDEGMAEIGFWAAAEARGRGVTTQAVAAVCRWGFDSLGLGRVEWYAAVGNSASRRVAEKVGFRYEGLMRHRLLHRGERLDAWAAGLLPGETREV